MTAYTGLGKLTYDWQTIITGGLAILAAIIGGGMAYRAGVIQARATQKAANNQIAAGKRTDQLRACAIARAIYPEVLDLEVSIKDTRRHLNEIIRTSSGRLPGQSVAAFVEQQVISIAVPPMLERFIDQLFILGDSAGPVCLQLVASLLKYRALAGSISSSMMVLNADSWAEEIIEKLDANLTTLGVRVAECKNELQPFAGQEAVSESNRNVLSSAPSRSF